jgi:hypothetical protein
MLETVPRIILAEPSVTFDQKTDQCPVSCGISFKSKGYQAFSKDGQLDV